MSERKLFISELSAVFEAELYELAAQGEQDSHSFSEGFNEKMRRLINAFPSRVKMTVTRHRKGIATAAAAAAALVLLSPALWAMINVISVNLFPFDGTMSSMPDESETIYCGDMYTVFRSYDYDQPTTFSDYNYFPDNEGKVTQSGEGAAISSKIKNVGDLRRLSDGIVVAKVNGEGEEHQTLAGVKYIPIELEVLYDITDKNNELHARKIIYIRRYTDSFPLPLEPDSFVLVMITKTDEGDNEYTLTNGALSCFYIDERELTVTSLSDSFVCAKYDGLPLGMLTYDILNDKDNYEEINKAYQQRKNESS